MLGIVSTPRLILTAVGAFIVLTLCAVLAMWWVADAKDVNIRQKIPGTWISDENADLSWKLKPELEGRSFSEFYMGEWTADGTWQVDDGFIVLTVTNSVFTPGSRPPIEHYRVADIEDHRMTLFRGTEPENFHKK